MGLRRHTPIEWFAVDSGAEFVVEQLDEVDAARAAVAIVAAVAAGV